MLPNLRDENQASARRHARARSTAHGWRPAVRPLFLSAAALLAATAAGACVEEPPCSETATCPFSGTDARAEGTGSADDGGSPESASDGGDAADVSNVDDRTDGPNRADALDASRDGDASISLDGISADRMSADGADARTDNSLDGSADADAPLCDLDAGRSPTDNPCIVSERYGIFVSPVGSDATGAGTRNAPFRTISRALQGAKAETMRVFACDEGSGYTDAINLDASLDGVAVFGGFDCTGWKITGNARTRVHPSTGPALVVSGLTLGATLENFELQAADGATGVSSIAVRVEASQQVILRRSRIVAGKGGAGANGLDGSRGSDGDPVGLDQQGRPAACNTLITGQSGGVGLSSACGSKGGEGGGCDSLLITGYPGYAGMPLQGVDPPGQQNGGTICMADCHGHRGSDGVAGAPGTANSLGGKITAAGYTAALPGGAGTPGHFAQGGGGGAGTVTDYSVTGCVGATGGAGGLGGCGGGAGTGGSAGGASIALFSWTSGITLDGCSLESADGGRGGNGGNGKVGGIGSQGAVGGDRYNDGTIVIYAGGTGGWGGAGGPGGGGAGGNGGPSYGIVYAGGRPSQIGGTTVVRGAGGAKGSGGFSGMADLPDGGAAEGGTPDGSSMPDAGGIRASDGLPGEAAYELAVP